jgi:riboflavin biosynthesis pyrimidine reductase
MTDALSGPAGAGSTRVQQIFPAPAELDASEIATSLELPSRPGADPELPRVVACWIASVDGRSTLARRSSGLGSAADRAVFRGLRAQADAILVGSRTLAIERYRRPGRNPGLRERRAALGLAEEPTVLVVSRKPSLPVDIPLLQDPAARVRILTWGDAKVPPLPATVEVTRLPRGAKPMRGALAAAATDGIRSVVCEGGPTLLGLLLAEDLLDELVVSTAPMLVGADELPVVTGSIAHPLRRFRLVALYRGEDHVFARYVRARQGG